MSTFTNEQEFNTESVESTQDLSFVEAEERLEMVQAAEELGISCCGDSSAAAK